MILESKSRRSSQPKEEILGLKSSRSHSEVEMRSMSPLMSMSLPEYEPMHDPAVKAKLFDFLNEEITKKQSLEVNSKN